MVRTPVSTRIDKTERAPLVREMPWRVDGEEPAP
jgi:hypothetical protein